MTLDTFFKTFDQFADAPDAVAKMRELVLQLAVRGKLVPQNVKDEPASAFLSRLQAQKAQLLNTGELKRQKLLALNGDTSDLPTLPKGWAWSSLGELSYFVTSGSRDWAEHYSDKGAIFVRMGNLSRNSYRLRLDKIQRVTPPDGNEGARTKLAAGDILISITGEVGLLGLIPSDFGDAYINQHTCLVRLPVELHNRFIPEFLRSSFAQEQFNAPQRGLKNSFRLTDVTSLLTPLPPLAEQKRIVAKVDELMALCDRLEAQQQERDEQASALARASLARFAEAPTAANLNLLFHKSYSIPPADLRKAILTQAVQGRLLPQDSKDESVDNLLKRCLSERTKLKRTTATAVQTISAENALGYSIPFSWRWQTLDDLLIGGPTNGFSPKAVDYETPVRSLTLSATTSGRFKGEHSKFIEMELADDAELWLRDGDILVQRGNTLEYVGVPAVYRGEPNQFIYPDLMMKLRVSSAFDVGYIYLAMSHEASRDFLRARASGTSGSMPKINQTALKSLPLPIPPLAEQRRIVAKVDQLMALVDQLETQLAESRATAKNLLEAFVAELTHT